MDDVIAGGLSELESNWCGLHRVFEEKCTGATLTPSTGS